MTSDTPSQLIAARLQRAGFCVTLHRSGLDSATPMWCAAARRRGKEWNVRSQNLHEAFRELERQVEAAAEPEPESIFKTFAMTGAAEFGHL